MFRRASVLLGLLSLTCCPAALAIEPVSSLPSEMPEKFTPNLSTYDYEKRDVMIPMRDGVKLRTFILVPKGAKNAPMIMTRTPYNAGGRVGRKESPHLRSVVPQMNDTTAEAGYIIVYQDVRGKWGSEGEYVLTRPLKGPLNPTQVDHSTDSYDTIDWLVKNVPESNGRIATMGGSYEGYTTVMSTVNPHPALKAAVPFAPMIDGWMGDDWFHNGAFRQSASLEFVVGQQAARRGDFEFWFGEYDTYETYLRGGSAGDLARSRGLEQLGFWRQLAAHTDYDFWWQNQAVDKLLAKEPLKVPMMIVGGLFDQEDIYGSPALFKALAPKDPKGEYVHLVLGPWNHGQGRREGRALGAIAFEGDTAGWFRRNVMQPFLDHYLKDAPKPATPRVLVYETGADQWRTYDQWPRSCAQGCAQTAKMLYLQADGKLSFDAPAATPKATPQATPKAAGEAFDEYVSDPKKPVPFRARPILAGGDTPTSGWGEWLADDQRHAASRTDVLVYETEPLTQPLRVAGQPIAKLIASTSGTDSDWVVKIIDVWPGEMPDNEKLGGYQQMVSADIFRGRFRTDFTKSTPLAPNKPLPYQIALPHVNHTFRPGHRIMVQIQSSWFPLYDRNPQKFVENIMWAKPADYVKATQRVWRAAGNASAIELPVIQ